MPVFFRFSHYKDVMVDKKSSRMLYTVIQSLVQLVVFSGNYLYVGGGGGWGIMSLYSYTVQKDMVFVPFRYV